MTTLTVGQGAQYSTLTAAVAASHSGDTIDVAAGTYTNDFPETITDDITIQGVGGTANFVATVAPPNGKAILVTNGNDTIENLSFSGAAVADGNGAGIRYQAGNLTLVDDYFHDNQDGLLAGANPTGTITINNTEFDHNGTGDGLTHNLYVGDIASLTIDNSLFMDAVVGHEIKSRAESTTIENSRIIDGPTGTSSYSIDLPDGGKAVIENNVIEQGPLGQNPNIIHYGGEGGPYAGSSLDITGNTILNDLHGGSAELLLNQTTITAGITDNQIYGLTAAQITKGSATESGNTFLTTEPTLDTSPPFTTTTTNGTAANVLAELNPAIPHPTADQFTVTTATTANQHIQAQPGDAMLIGAANGDVLLGGNGFDVLAAGAGTETLQGSSGTTDFLGGAGTDTLYAGSGVNYLQGGTGRDTFHFGDNASGNSTVYAFNSALDHIIVTAPAALQVSVASLVQGITADAAGDAVVHLQHSEVVLAGITPAHVDAGWFTVDH